jgi:branched-chain amino acid transport system ATP-binding protein
VRELGRIVGDLKRDGAAILLVEQNLAFALRVADHVYIMSKGRIVVDCAPEELRRRDDLKARWLGI